MFSGFSVLVMGVGLTLVLRDLGLGLLGLKNLRQFCFATLTTFLSPPEFTI